MKNVGLINHHKLLARIHKLEQTSIKYPEHNGNILTVIHNFKLAYPNIDLSDLKYDYDIDVGKGVIEKIHNTIYSEYELPFMDGYKELLELQLLCNKYFKPTFPTMVGETYWNMDDFREYEVIYIQKSFKLDQIFLLINKERNVEIIVKVNEWNCGHLNGTDNMYATKEQMLNNLLSSYSKRYKDDLERVERLKNS